MNKNNISQFLKTPSQLIAMYPECGWTPQQIGYLLMLGMVRGLKVPDTCLIYVTSFEAAMLHRININASVIQIKTVTKKELPDM